jgi:hypothetical protein
MLVSTHLWRFGERFAPELEGRLPEIAYYAMDNQLTPIEAALKPDFVAEAEFDRVVDPGKVVRPCVAAAPVGCGLRAGASASTRLDQERLA